MSSKALTDSDIARFWNEFSPQIQEVLAAAEDRETWVYQRHDLPELFDAIQTSLPDVVQIPPSPEQTSILNDLISCLASVPFRECIAALAYLERNSLKESLSSDEVGTGTAAFMVANRICLSRSGDVASARIVRDRVQFLVKVGFQISSFKSSAEEVASYA